MAVVVVSEDAPHHGVAVTEDENPHDGFDPWPVVVVSQFHHGVAVVIPEDSRHHGVAVNGYELSHHWLDPVVVIGKFQGVGVLEFQGTPGVGVFQFQLEAVMVVVVLSEEAHHGVGVMVLYEDCHQGIVFSVVDHQVGDWVHGDGLQGILEDTKEIYELWQKGGLAVYP